VGKVAASPASDLGDLLRAEEITRPLLKNSELMNDLGAIVAALAAGGQRATTLRALGSVPLAKVGPKGRALARALTEVERLVREQPMATILTWIDGGTAAGVRSPVWNPKMRAAGGIGSWLEALGELRSQAQTCAAVKWNRDRRGRPPDPLREQLCSEVARALDRAGLELAKGRDGLFARVLVAALTAAEWNVPEDVFPLLRKALRTVTVPR
jgi:hypothetical protein